MNYSFNLFRKSFMYKITIFNAYLLLCIIGSLYNHPLLAEDLQNNPQKNIAPQDSSETKKQKSEAERMSHKAEGVISLDAVVDGEKVYVLLGKNNHSHVSLWLQISKNGGQSWSPELEVPIPAASGATISRGSDAKIIKSGNKLFVIWMSHVEGARFGSGPLVSMISLDEGKSWQRVVGPADWTQGPHGFFSLSNSKNTLHATWLDKRDGQISTPGSQGLRYAYSNDGGKNWSKNITLDEVACACCWTKILNDKAGNLYVLYRDKQPSDMSIGVIDLSDHQWTRLSTVGAFDWDFSGCPHIGGGLVIKEHGLKKELHALVGTRKAGNAGLYHLSSRDGGKSWSLPIKLGDDSATHGDITVDRKSRLVVVWDMLDTDANDGSMAIFFSQSNDGKRWSSPLKISSNAKSASHPMVVSTPLGSLALWTEKDNMGISLLAFKKLSAQH